MSPDVFANIHAFRNVLPGVRNAVAPGEWTQFGANCHSVIPTLHFPSQYRTAQMADVNSDGNDDFVVLLAGIGVASGVYTYLSDTAAGFIAPEGGAVANPPWAGADFESESVYSTMQTGDFDGDGRADLLIRRADIGVQIYLSAFADVEGDWVPWPGEGIEAASKPYNDAAGWDVPCRYGTIQAGDVNGDGYSDVIALDTAGVVVHENDGGGGWIVTEADPPLVGPAWQEKQHCENIFLADVAADPPGFEGAEEIVARDECGVWVWQRNQSTRSWSPLREPDCTPSDPAAEFSDAEGWDSEDQYLTLQSGDLNADGCADLVSRGERALRVWLSACDGEFTEIDSSVDLPDFYNLNPVLPGWEDEGHYGTLQLGDVNGDDKLDLIGRGPSGIQTWLSNGDGTFSPADHFHPFWGDLFPNWMFALFPQQSFADAAHWETIMLGNLDGSAPGSQLFGIRDCGAEVWDFVP